MLAIGAPGGTAAAFAEAVAEETKPVWFALKAMDA